MRRIVLASHHNLADGMKDTLKFLSGLEDVYAISAYTDDKNIEDEIEEVFSNFRKDDEIIIFTDMLGGSVNQKFYEKMNDYTFLICGMNLPLVLGIALLPEGSLTQETIATLVEDAKQQVIFMNTYQTTTNEDDE